MIGKIFEKAKISRRNLLKSIGIIAGTASIYGCSKDGADYQEIYDPDNSLLPSDDLVLDKDVKQCFSSGAYNCGSRCVHKLQVKNGRIIKFTSAGDIERSKCLDLKKSPDESVGENFVPTQHRACVRGYSYIQRLYQPDKLKYPLRWFGNGPEDRGKVECFKRVTWENAFSAAVDAIANAVSRKSELGYSPIMIKWINTLNHFDYFKDPVVAPCIHFLGNESTGAYDAVKYDVVGPDAVTNNVADRLNSKFIITWGLDPSRATFHVGEAHWYNTKAKEKDIDIVCITTNYNDSAAIIATGTTVNVRGQAVSIPGWIPCRPATDGALAAAMAYVIYKNKLYDEEYVKKGNKKSFGFFPEDECISTAPYTEKDGKKIATVSRYTLSHMKNMKTPKDFSDEAGVQFKKGDPYTGAKFKVPKGESFSEYLDNLEVIWGKAEAAGKAIVGDTTYKNILEYAERLTGVPTDIIEGLAYKYATTKPALLDVGGGPQRAWNGFEWVWLIIALTTMTGNVDKPGGGAGFSMMSHADTSIMGIKGMPNMALVPPSAMLGDADRMNAIYIPMNNWAHVVLTGKDRRSTKRLIEDIKITTSRTKDGLDSEPKAGLDLSKRAVEGKKILEVDVWFMTENNIITTAENINKNIEAIKQIKNVIVLDQVMTPSALFATIILPVTSHYEKSNYTTEVSISALFAQEQAIERLYDTKTDSEIKSELIKRLNERLKSTYDPKSYADSTPEALKYTVDQALGATMYYEKATGIKDASYSYDTMVTTGVTDLVIPPDKPLVGFRDFPHSTPGKLENSTGKINFYSPLWGKIRKKESFASKSKVDAVGNTITNEENGIRHATAQYEPHIEGYEKFFSDKELTNFTGFKSPLSKRTYPLYFMTNKARNRAHTVLDNVAMIKDEFKQCVKMNPKDANDRGIKDGDIVYVYNDRGCSKIPAEVTITIPPGIVSIEHGAWYRAHPTETVKVWMQDDITEQFHEKRVPVDVGGAENILTLDVGSTEQYVGQATNAQSGPCEVSLFKPE